MGIANGYDRLAMDLGDYCARYVPGNWIVDIQNVHPIPWIQSREAKEFYLSSKEGTLADKLKEKKGIFAPWFVQEAINSFFEKKPFKEYSHELLE